MFVCVTRPIHQTPPHLRFHHLRLSFFSFFWVQYGWRRFQLRLSLQGLSLKPTSISSYPLMVAVMKVVLIGDSGVGKSWVHCLILLHSRLNIPQELYIIFFSLIKPTWHSRNSKCFRVSQGTNSTSTRSLQSVWNSPPGRLRLIRKRWRRRSGILVGSFRFFISQWRCCVSRGLPNHPVNIFCFSDRSLGSLGYISVNANFLFALTCSRTRTIPCHYFCVRITSVRFLGQATQLLFNTVITAVRLALCLFTT